MLLVNYENVYFWIINNIFSICLSTVQILLLVSIIFGIAAILLVAILLWSTRGLAFFVEIWD